MTIRIAFVTAVVRKHDLSRLFPGGIDAFKNRFRPSQDDGTLVAISAMSTGEIGELLEHLEKAGFDAQRFVGVCDATVGPLSEVSGIAFVHDPNQSILQQWLAREEIAPGDTGTSARTI